MLTRKDLKAGDIMCQFVTNSLAGAAIALGQALTLHRNAGIVHAGILFDDTYIIEALNKGIRAADLRIQDRKLAYAVYRATNPMLARGAADCANMMLKINAAQKTLSYDVKGAVGSIFGGGTFPKTPAEMDQLLDRILSGKDNPFFCSQFVVYVYQFVAEQSGMAAASIINLSDPKVPPAKLKTFLDGSPNFKYVGELPAGAR